MTDTEILDGLGSASDLAAKLSALTACPLDREAVYKWRERGRIAAKWRPWVIDVAQRSGLEVPSTPALPLPQKAA